MLPRFVPHLSAVQRTAHFHEGRLGMLRLDGNELAPNIGEEFFQKLLQRLSADQLSAYPELRQLYRRFAAATALPEECLLLTSGCEGAIRAVFESMLSAGDRVLSVVPTYGMYEVYTKIYGGVFSAVSMDARFCTPLDELLAAIDPRCKVIVIANPNGATGSILSPANLDRLYARAESVGALLLIDEAYIEFSGQKSMLAAAAERPNMVVARTFSKAYGLAGLRIGYLAAAPATREVLFRGKSLYELSSVSIAAAELALEWPELLQAHLAEISASKLAVAAAFERAGVPIFVGAANFVLARLEGRCAEFKQYCREAGVLVRDHEGASLLGPYVRVTAGRREAARRVCELIRTFF